MNLTQGIHRASYNKVGIDYEPKNNAKMFSNICHANIISKCNTLKCNYYNKNDQAVLFCIIMKVRKSILLLVYTNNSMKIK